MTATVSQVQRFGSIHVDVGSSLTLNVNQVIQIAPDTILARSFNATSPYIGLSRFEEKHRDLFFGRDPLVAALFSAVVKNPLTLVAGASGCGKSSLVRAGVIPQLNEKQPKDTFHSFTFTPFRNPFESLRISLISGGCNPDLVKIPVQPSASTLVDLVTAVRKPGDSWLLFIDQFEEVFTLCVDKQLRDAFLNGLVKLADSSRQDVRLLLAMRADFFDRFGPYPELAELATQNLHLITDMQRSQLRVAIEQPAAHHGVVFEATLVKEIIDDLERQPGALPLLQYTLDLLWREDNPADDRTLNITSYRKIGGIEGALEERANQLYDYKDRAKQVRRSADEQEAIRRLFLRLVDLTGSGADARAVSKRTPRDEFDTALEQALITELIDEKLLVGTSEVLPEPVRKEQKPTPTLRGAPTVELAHEALLNAWPKLKDWIAQGAEVIFVRNRLEADARHWLKAQVTDKTGSMDQRRTEDELWGGSRLDQAVEMARQGDFDSILGGLKEKEKAFLDASVEQRRKRNEAEYARLRQRRRLLLSFGTIVSGVFILALVAAEVARQQRRQAQRNERVAISRQLAANANGEFARKDELATLLGISALRAADTSEAVEFLFRAMARGSATRQLTTAAKMVEQKIDDSASSWDDSEVLAGLYSRSGDKLAILTASRKLIVVDRVAGQQRNYPLPKEWDEGHRLGENSFGNLGDYMGDKIHFDLEERSVFIGSQLNGLLRIELTTGQAKLQIPPLNESQQEKAAEFSEELNTQILEEATSILKSDDDKQALMISLPLLARSMSEFSPDGRRFATVLPEGSLNLWDTETGRLVNTQLPPESQKAHCLAFSSDSQRLAAAAQDGTIKIWNAATGKPVAAPIAKRAGLVVSLAFSPNNEVLIVRLLDQTIRLFDLTTGKPTDSPIPVALPVPSIKDGDLRHLVFSADGSTLALALADNKVYIGDVQKRTWNKTPLENIEDRVAEIALSPSGRFCAVAFGLSNVQIWNTANSRPFGQIFELSKVLPRELQFSSNERELLVLGVGDHLLIRLPGAGEFGRALSRASSPLQSVRFSPNGQTLAVTGHDGQIELWDAQSRRPLGAPITGHTGKVFGVAFTPSGAQLASTGQDGTVRLWDLATRQPIGEPLKGHNGAVYQVAISPNPAIPRMASSGWDKTVKLWDLALPSRAPITLTGHTQPVLSVAFRSDGSRIASGGMDGTVRLWNGKTGGALCTMSYLPACPEWKKGIELPSQLRAKLEQSGCHRGGEIGGHTDAVSGVAFSPDGTLVASASWDGTIRLSSASDCSGRGQLFTNKREPLHSVSFNLAGDRLAASSDKSLSIWDVRTRRTLNIQLEGHTDLVTGLAFNDKDVLASAGRDGTVRLWNLNPVSWARILCSSIERELSQTEWEQFISAEPFPGPGNGLCKRLLELSMNQGDLANW